MPTKPSLPSLADSVSPRFDVFYWSCFFLGCGVFMPYNMLTCAVDYFKEAFSDYEATRWTATCYLTFTLLGSLGNSFFPPSGVGHLRVSLGFFIFSLFMSVIPVMDYAVIADDGGTMTSFLLLLLCVTLLGVFNGIALGSFTGLMAHLPFRHFQGYMGGWGIAGILTVALRAATKAAFPDSSDGLRQSARIYFFSATLVCLSCLLVQRWVIVPSSVWTADLSMLEEGDPLLLDISSDRSGSIDVEGPWWRTVKKTRLASANTFITLFILSVMFPGVASDAESETLGDWYGILLLFLLNITNHVGRYSPMKWIPNSPVVSTALVCSRLLLIPTTFFAMMYFSNPFVISSLTALVGLSNGYTLLCSFKMTQTKLHSKAEQFISGNISSFIMMLAFCLGSFGSLLWSVLS